MKTLVKLLPYIVTALLVGTIALHYYNKSCQLDDILKARDSELLQGDMKLGRAKTRLADARAMIENLDERVQEEIKKRQASVNLYSDLEARYEAEETGVKIITRVVYRKRGDNISIKPPDGVMFIKTEDNKFKEVTSMKFAYEDFRITIDGDAVQQTLSYKLHQRFRGTFTETTLPTGARNHYAAIYEMNKKGEDIGKMQLEKFNVVRSNELKARMFWWNPKIDLHVGVGVDTVPGFSWVADVGVSFSAYGLTKNDLSWRFFRLGLGVTNQNFSLTIVPAQYNLGSNLPLISNLWVTPFAGWNVTSNLAHFGLGVAVVF